MAPNGITSSTASTTRPSSAVYDAFARWNKTRNWFTGGVKWKIGNILLTFHAVAFGLLLFSGRLAYHPPPPHEELVEKLTCTEITGTSGIRASQTIR